MCGRFTLNTSFTASGGCPGPDPNRFEFDVADLDAVAPHLDDLAATSDFGTDFAVGPPCRASEVPSSHFGDLGGNTHEAAVDCLAWHGIAAGRGGDRFDPASPVTRGQLASFVARLLEEASPAQPRVWVLERAGRVLGFAAAGRPDPPDGHSAGELFALYLHPAAWNRGFGRALRMSGAQLAEAVRAARQA